MIKDEIEKDINDIKNTVNIGFARINEKLSHMENTISDLSANVNGSGDEGLRMDVAKLKQSDKKREQRETLITNSIITICICIIGIILRLFFDV